MFWHGSLKKVDRPRSFLTVFLINKKNESSLTFVCRHRGAAGKFGPYMRDYNFGPRIGYKIKKFTRNYINFLYSLALLRLGG